MFAIKAISYDAADAPAVFTASLKDTGFAVLKNHPIAPERIDAAYAAWAAFFASSDKAAFGGADGAPEGYFPFRSENAKGAKHKDLKEFFQVYPRTRLPEGARSLTRALYDDLMHIGATLLTWIEANAPASVRAGFRAQLEKG